MIDFINVQKSFVDKDILKNGNIRINKGEHVGLVGPNGAGKSTVFNMIIGIVEPDRGEIQLPKNTRLGYLKQELSAADVEESLIDYTADAMPELRECRQRISKIEAQLGKNSNNDALDELGELQTKYENLGGYEMSSKAEKALSGLGFKVENFDQPLSNFSGGWQMRARLAQTLIPGPDILLLDEPSNYLDVPAIEWLRRYLKTYDGTLLLVSHDRFLLNTLTNVTIEINAGLVSRYVGDYDHYVKERKTRFESLEAAKNNQDKRRDQLQKSINRFRAKSTKASQVQSWIREIDNMDSIDIPDRLNYSGTIRIPPPPSSGVEMMRLENIGHAYSGEEWILKDLNIEIGRGDKIGIVGYNGMGKTTLLRIIAGELVPTGGKRVIGHNVVVGYQAQEFADILPPSQRIFDIVRNAAAAGSTDKDTRSVLASFGFQGEAVNKPCEVLSGGEKIRLAFARIFINPPNLLILDEPTTHLDIAAREGLQEAVQKYQGTVCLVSHDIEFLRHTATTIFAMDGHLGVKKYFGDYDYYRDKTTGESADTVGDVSKNAPRGTSRDSERKKVPHLKKDAEKNIQKRRKSLEKKAEKLESKIDEFDAEKARLAGELEGNEPGLDFATISRTLKELNDEIDACSEAWNQIADEIDELGDK